MPFQFGRASVLRKGRQCLLPLYLRHLHVPLKSSPIMPAITVWQADALWACLSGTQAGIGCPLIPLRVS